MLAIMGVHGMRKGIAKRILPISKDYQRLGVHWAGAALVPPVSLALPILAMLLPYKAPYGATHTRGLFLACRAPEKHPVQVKLRLTWTGCLAKESRQ